MNKELQKIGVFPFSVLIEPEEVIDGVDKQGNKCRVIKSAKLKSISLILE